MITRVRKVIVPVQDQQAALDFWTTCMEFTIVRDDSYGDERWTEITPPNQDLLLVLCPGRPDEPRRTVHDRLPHSDLFFDCADIEQTHRRLSHRGVRFPLPPAKEHFGWWALFEDNEGTRYALGQTSDHQFPTPDSALRRLDFLVGTWRVDGETTADFSGPAIRSTSIETFEWLHGGFFLVHRWNAVFGDPEAYAGPELPGRAIQKGIMFCGFDAVTGRYRTHFFDGNGPFHDGSRYEGEVVDGNLRFTGSARFTLIPNDNGTVLFGAARASRAWFRLLRCRSQRKSASAHSSSARRARDFRRSQHRHEQLGASRRRWRVEAMAAHHDDTEG